jgi:hypothetical protein
MPDSSPLSDAQAKRLIQLYGEAEKEILKECNRLLLKNPESYSLAWQKTLLARVQQIRGDLLAGSRTWCEQAIPDSYMKGVTWADADPLSGQKVLAGFGSIHQQAVEVLADNAYSRLEDVNNVVGRRVNDVFRSVALENAKGSVIGYQTTRQTAKRIREDLAEHGITGFVDRAGHEWDMRRYAKVLAQETTNGAFRQGTINRLQEKGHDLVRLSSHSGSCPKCTPWEGRTLSMSGTDKEYPALDEARSAGVFHVGCLHVVSLAPEELDRFLGKLQGKEGEAARQAEITRLAEKAGWKNPIRAAPPEEFIRIRDMLPKIRRDFLTPYTADQYKTNNVKLKLHESSAGGYGLKGDELISVFSLPGKHLGSELVDDAIANGAKRLDCLGEPLLDFYTRKGFKLVKTDKWNDRFAPKNWDYAKSGRPDLYYMELEK